MQNNLYPDLSSIQGAHSQRGSLLSEEQCSELRKQLALINERLSKICQEKL